MAESIYRVVALRLREERRQAELTLEQLGERAGITGAFIAHIEAGRKRPTLDTLEKLARALGLSVASLLATGGEADDADQRSLQRIARYLAPLSAAQKRTILKIVRLGAELVQR